MVRQMADQIPGVAFPDTDFVQVAEGLGGRGVHVTDPEDLVPALENAKASDEPTVVDVRIDRDEDMADQLASSFYDEVGGLHE
jgi:acetolactate synthase-1/2/3 large subunit